MNDKRKFERFDITAPARIEILKPGENGGKILLETHNLSAGGIFIKSARLLPEGSPVKMEILLHFSEPETQTPPDSATVIVVTGHIIRSTDEGMAICFNDDYDIKSAKDYRILE
ncbi:MAG: PilZ domain-containing protein [Pseudomonadota bacterium]